MDRRGALILGMASALGGLPPARPDQLTFPPPGGQEIPGARTPVVASRVVIFGTGKFKGLFVYSPTPGAGNLIASIAPAANTDQFGNAYLAGVTSYAQQGGTFVASQLRAGILQFLTAPAAGGPWTSGPSIVDIAGGLLLQAPGATTEIQQQLIAEGGIDITGGGLIVHGGTNTDSLVTGGIQATGGVSDKVVINGASATGLLLQVINATINATNELVRLVTPDTGSGFLGFRVAGDTFNRIILNTDNGGLAQLRFGPGTAGVDITVKRLAAGLLGIMNTDLAIDSVGRGLQVKEGANAKQGRATLVNGTVTVANTSVTVNSGILLTTQDNAFVGTLGVHQISARVPGTSFTILSTSNTDNSTDFYEIFEGAP